MEDERLKKAIALAQQAVTKDNEKKYEEALELYKTSLDYWSLVFKYQTNPALKERLGQKMGEYLNRAEQIKKFLTDKQAPQPVPIGEDKQENGNKGGGGDSKEDAEKDKLKSALASAIVTEKPNVKWSDVAGLEGAKEALQEAVILPSKFPQLFTGNRKPWRGILLYGPPGTGKSYLAKACATECGGTFLSVSSSDLVSKWQGESERLVKTLFEMARASKPAIIFIDEVDSLCSSRSEGENDSSRRIKTEFLVQMQGVGKDDTGILVLGATNVPWELDSAIRRRFERRIYIPLPEVNSRKTVFQLNIGKTPNNLTDADFTKLAEATEGFSGADISILVRDALFQPIRRCRAATHFQTVIKDGKEYLAPCSPGMAGQPGVVESSLMAIPSEKLLPPDLTMLDFEDVILNAKPSVGPNDLKQHTDWTAQFGSEGS
eukprot:GDKI01043607.1.p1 GENE.GDKI01043607.1~~GDKI01043607.1.p1  ORF type:complete len:433 (+),score=138.28 GDKI01043607.1:78-1376(+)